MTFSCIAGTDGFEAEAFFASDKKTLSIEAVTKQSAIAPVRITIPRRMARPLGEWLLAVADQRED